jgi:hypothetical protein
MSLHGFMVHPACHGRSPTGTAFHEAGHIVAAWYLGCQPQAAQPGSPTDLWLFSHNGKPFWAWKKAIILLAGEEAEAYGTGQGLQDAEGLADGTHAELAELAAEAASRCDGYNFSKDLFRCFWGDLANKLVRRHFQEVCAVAGALMQGRKLTFEDLKDLLEAVMPRVCKWKDGPCPILEEYKQLGRIKTFDDSEHCPACPVRRRLGRPTSPEGVVVMAQTGESDYEVFDYSETDTRQGT